jgi:hypothetical protein
VNEKIRSEAATYITIRNKCPEIPIPELLGFGLTDGNAVSSVLIALHNLLIL